MCNSITSAVRHPQFANRQPTHLLGLLLASVIQPMKAIFHRCSPVSLLLKAISQPIGDVCRKTDAIHQRISAISLKMNAIFLPIRLIFNDLQQIITNT